MYKFIPDVVSKDIYADDSGLPGPDGKIWSLNTENTLEKTE